MKRIGIISDTHSYLDPQIEQVFEDCDEIWHLGDIGSLEVTDTLSQWKKVRAVYGNIDHAEIRRTFPEYEILNIDGFKVLLIHIAGKFGYYTQQVRELLKLHTDIQCIICGHSHILKVQFDKRNNLLYINPGAAGKHGFHQVRTLLKCDIGQAKIENMQVIELGKRGQL